MKLGQDMAKTGERAEDVVSGKKKLFHSDRYLLVFFLIPNSSSLGAGPRRTLLPTAQQTH